MKSELLEFIRGRGTVPSLHGTRTLFKHCAEPSKANPMACIHGQPWVTVAAFDDGRWKKSIVVGMYSPPSRGYPALLRHPEIIYSSCGHCEVPVSYNDDIDKVNMTWHSDGIDAIAAMADSMLARMRLMEFNSVITEMPQIAA